MTLAEHDALLKSEGRYDAMAERNRSQEEERLSRANEWSKAEQPLVHELRNAGFSVNSVWDLVNTSTTYDRALPILANHLDRPYPSRVREGIARAMAVPEAKFAWKLLTRLYRVEGKRDAKDGLAAAIAAAADDTTIGDVVALALDASHGASRLLLLSALQASRDPRARAALDDLALDPDLNPA